LRAEAEATRAGATATTVEPTETPESDGSDA
jgi:hypothetical protein